MPATPSLSETLTIVGTAPSGVAVQRVSLVSDDGSIVGGSGGANTGAVTVAGTTLHPSVNPVLSAPGAYATGDYVGTTATPMSFVGATRVANGTGVLASALLIDKALQSITAELWLFDRSVTTPTDNTAWTITDANAQFLLGVISFSAYYASGANSVAVATGLNLAIWANAAATIYGALVTRGAPTYASLDLTVVLGILAD